MSEETPEQHAPETPAAAPVEAGGGRRIVSVVWLLVAGMLVVALAVAAYGPVPITIDGSLTVVPRGASVSSVRDEGLLGGARGDLVSLHGRLLTRGGGELPAVLVDGQEAATLVALRPGARLTTVRGADTVEGTAPRTVETTPGVRYVGRGPVHSIEESGTPGTAVAIVGAVSGEELSRSLVSPGRPMTVRREPAWPGRKEVALTFDDGPWPVSTDGVLAQLKAAGVKATFFMIGRQVKSRPETAKRVLAAGMEIGDHSWSHKLLRHRPHKTITSEIKRGAQAIERVLAVRPLWFRPPGGSTNAFVRHEAKRFGMRTVLWTIDPRDWSRPGARLIATRVLDRVRPGSVILMHDGGGDRSQTLEALAIVLHGLKARGYSMVTLSALRGLPKSNAPKAPPTLLDRLTVPTGKP